MTKQQPKKTQWRVDGEAYHAHGNAWVACSWGGSATDQMDAIQQCIDKCNSKGFPFLRNLKAKESAA
jgi:hypothetical protein